MDPQSNEQNAPHKNTDTSVPSADAVAQAFSGMSPASRETQNPNDGLDAPAVEQVLDIEKELGAAGTLPESITLMPAALKKEVAVVQPTAPRMPHGEMPPLPPSNASSLVRTNEKPMQSGAFQVQSQMPKKIEDVLPQSTPVPLTPSSKQEIKLTPIPPQAASTPTPRTQTPIELAATIPAQEKVIESSAQSPTAPMPEPGVFIAKKPAPTTPTGPQITGIPQTPERPKENKRLSVLEQLRALTASPLHPLRTYKSDAAQSVRANNTSIVTMAAAEERRRTERTAVAERIPERTEPKKRRAWGRMLLITSSILLILTGIAGLVVVYLNPRSVEIETTVAPSNLIYIDESRELPLARLDHLALVTQLTQLRDETTLSLGLMREIFFTLPMGSTTDVGSKRLATTQEVMKILAPRMPPGLLRALNPEFVLGVHVFDGNQGAIVLRTDAYEQAYSGLLEWEPSMRADLLPFIDRRPRPRLPNETRASTTTPRVIASSFVDRVIRNYDARVLYSNEGDIVLLYAFINQHTIAITTNENTLAELASRIKNPPIQGL